MALAGGSESVAVVAFESAVVIDRIGVLVVLTMHSSSKNRRVFLVGNETTISPHNCIFFPCFWFRLDDSVHTFFISTMGVLVQDFIPGLIFS